MKIQSSPTLIAGLSLFSGAILGLGTGVLFAPRSGERTRRKIKDLVEDAGEHIEEKKNVAKKSVTRIFNRMSTPRNTPPKKGLFASFRLNTKLPRTHSKQRLSMVK